MSAPHTGYAFDAAALLGIGTPSADPLPPPVPGEIVLRIPAGLTLQTLRDSDVGKQFMHRQNWYDKYGWSQESLPAGDYRLRVPVPDSNRKTATEQDSNAQKRTVNSLRVELAWSGGRLYVIGYWGDDRSRDVWASSVRTS